MSDVETRPTIDMALEHPFFKVLETDKGTSSIASYSANNNNPKRPLDSAEHDREAKRARQDQESVLFTRSRIAQKRSLQEILDVSVDVAIRDTKSTTALP